MALASTVTGQLWFGTEGNGSDARIAHVNNDGSNQTVVIDNSPTVDLGTSFPQHIGLDTAAGYYFAIVNGGNLGSGAYLVRGSLAGGAVTVVANYTVGGEAGDDNGDDNLVNALIVDDVNHFIYVGVQEPTASNPSQSGIRRYSYNPLTGAVTDNGFIVTAASDGNPANVLGDTLDVRDFALDRTHNTLFYVERLDGNEQAVYRMDLATHTVVQMSNSSQFPDDGSLGNIGSVEVDSANRRVYFTTFSQAPSGDGGYVAGQNHIWMLADNATNAIAVAVTISGLPGGAFYPADMVFDAQSRQIYVTSEETGGSEADDVIYVLQLDSAGTTATYVRSIAPNPAFSSTANIDGLAFDALPVLSSLAGTSTAAVEGGSAVTVLSGQPSISDVDGGYLASATVQITAGTFSSNENSTADDHLSVLASALSGTNITASYNASTETLTLTGYDTLAHYQQALAGVQYSATGDNPTNYGSNTTRTLTFTVNDGAPGIPGGQQNSGTTTVTVAGVNDGPVNTVPGSQTIAEDTALVFSTANGNALSVADVDAGPSAVLTVTLNMATGGTLTLASTSGLMFSNGDGLADTSMTFSGTIAQINAALGAGLTFNPFADHNGGDVLSITTSDNGSSGNGGSQSGSSSIAIAVTAAPDISDDSATTNEDTPVAIGVQANDTFENADRRITGFTQGSFGTVVLNDNGTAFNYADDYFTYSPDADVAGTDFFTYTVTAGGVTETATVSVTVIGVNDAPTLTATASNPIYVEDGSSQPVFANVSASTGEAGQSFTAMTLTVSNVTVGDTLTIDGAEVGLTDGAAFSSTHGSIAVSVSGGVATLTVSLSSTLEAAALQTLIEGIAFYSTSDDPGNADRVVTITSLTDDGGTANGGHDTAALTVSSTVHVTPVNDAPFVSGTPPTPRTYTENGAAVAALSGVVISTGEASQLITGATIRVAGVHDAGEYFTIDGSSVSLTNGTSVVTSGNGLTATVVVSGTTATVTLTSAAGVSAATMQTILNAVQYGDAGDNPTAGYRAIMLVSVTDDGGTANGGHDTGLPTAPGVGSRINVVATDDTAVAQPDTATLNANVATVLDVLANDSDPDGPPLSIAQINGMALSAGDSVTLDSGAVVTLNADGTLGYDPNGAFDGLISSATAAATGASNTSAVETFTYTLAGGNTVTVALTINGVDGPGDQLRGTSGNDTITGLAGDDVIYGGKGNDVLTAGDGTNSLHGSGGNDKLIGGSGDDRLDGGSGIDSARYSNATGGVQIDLTTTQPQDTLGAGTDTLINIENLIGSNYDDVLIGSGANNTIWGIDGDDKLIGGDGADSLFGGNGVDSVRYSDAASGVTVSLATSAPQETGGGGRDTLTGIENLIGSLHDDVLTGDDGRNTLWGTDGADVLDGGLGSDWLDGGTGQDTFRFTTTLGPNNVDRINDFSVADDTIALGHEIFAGLDLGALSAGTFTIGSAAQDADDRIIYNRATGALLFDQDGSGSAYAAVQFATIGRNLEITAANFTVI